MATASRPPGPNEARVLCPVCGGLIHPIAGRCKHCKTDLSAFRAQRPQAAAQLPALAQRAEAQVPQQHAAIAAPAAPQAYNGNGHSAPTAQQPSPWAPPTAHQAYQAQAPQAQPQPVTPSQLAQEAAQPILPPRPSGMSWTHMQRQGPTRSAWRSWPMVVIILAMIAIVTAVVIMVWPSSGRADADRKGTLEPPPAPEKMDTAPTPQAPSKAPAADDPWGPSGQVTPNAPGADPGAMAQVAMKHFCDRMTQCANLGSLRTVCAAIPSATAPSCPAAQRCLDHIDTLSCSTSTDDDALAVVTTLMQKVPDCLDAVKC